MGDKLTTIAFQFEQGNSRFGNKQFRKPPSVPGRLPCLAAAAESPRCGISRRPQQ